MLFDISSTFYFVLIGYFVVILAIGYWSGRGNKSSEDYLVAGRSIGCVVGGASLAATQMSAGTFVGSIGVFWMTGISYVWFWPGLWAGWLISALWVAPKMQEFHALTVPDYIEKRYNSKVAKTIAAVLIFIALTVSLIGQYVAGGILMQTVFGIPMIYGSLITIGVTIIYTFKGGMRASAYSDFVQAMIMAGCFFAAVPILMMQAGGLDFAVPYLTELDPRITGWFYSFKDLLGFALAFGIGMAVMPYELAKIYTLKSKRTARLAIGIGMIFQAIVGLSVCLVGTVMRAVYPVLATGDAASPLMAATVVPPLVGALLVIAILAAVMSTVSGIVIVASSALSHDLYGIINPKATDQQKMRLNRICCLITAAIPMIFAIRPFDMVQFIVILQSSLIASFFFPAVAIGLNWKGATKAGAIVSMAVGFIVVMSWRMILARPFGIHEVIPGVLFSCLVFFIVSKFTKPLPREALLPFFKDV